MWAADQFLATEYDKSRMNQGLDRSRQATDRKVHLREVLARSIGVFEKEENHTPVLLEEMDCGTYIRKRVELSATPGLTFPAYVLVPKGFGKTKLPGVVAVHGHGYGSRQILGMHPDGSWDEGEPGIYHNFALEFVHRGMVVIAPDVVGFGERRLQSDLKEDPNAPSSCYTMAAQLLMVGKTLTGLRIQEALCTLDYFSGLEEVDPEHIGIMGFSGGGLIAFIASVLDERLHATVLAGFPNTFKESILAVHHCLCNYTPGILNHAELPELISLIAPRPLFLESGLDDPIFPKEGFIKAVEVIQAAYTSIGKPDLLATDLFPGAHEISGRLSYDWMYAKLTE
ncbi:dienelactone hydrolase [Paenibacillus ferrarius]|uniref:Dienelactone hydrolase n=1 Tax=Paenibacillus ferrarius TaxID=1469647 RepID=A0A1V4H5U6_9BACL|nr:alpha/beta hydrolase family protein [Paenibacillus ferrarius]OPH46589.1 dienelactone hydrolase [Paenibacillus ferrarius]